MEQNDQILAKVRSQIRQSLRRQIASDQLFQMLFSVRLKSYCAFLSTLPPVDDTDYMEVYRTLLRYSQMEARSGKASLADKPLTVGWMLLKGQDLIYHEEEYSSVLDPVTMLTIKPRFIGEYIVDMLLIKPMQLMVPKQDPPEDDFFSEGDFPLDYDPWEGIEEFKLEDALHTEGE